MIIINKTKTKKKDIAIYKYTTQNEEDEKKTKILPTNFMDE